MNPLIIVALGIGIAKLLSNTEKTGIATEDINMNYLKDIGKQPDMTKTKRHVTRTVNLISSKYSKFKIGKSGEPTRRAKEYEGYKAMYLISVSSNRAAIETLEAHFNEKFINNPKNLNSNKGTAGVMSDTTGWFFLYIAVR